MKKGLRFSLILTCLLFFCLAGGSLFAQFPQTLEIGPHAGVTTYQGDINPLKFFSQPGYEYGGLVRYTYDTRWAFQADYSYGLVRASDVKANWRPERGCAFKTKFHDVALVAEFNFMDYYTGRRESNISPYFFAGISWFKYKVGLNPLNSLQREQFTGLTTGLNLDTTLHAYQKAYNEVAEKAYHQGYNFSIPFGFGCKFSLSQHIAASIEWRMHYTFTDQLDGVHGVYPVDALHQFFTWTKSEVTKTDADGNVVIDADGNDVKYDHIDYKVVQANPAEIANSGYDFYYDLTDPTGTFHENQQRGDASTNDWFGMINLSITWKIPIPGNSACKIVY